MSALVDVYKMSPREAKEYATKLKERREAGLPFHDDGAVANRKPRDMKKAVPAPMDRAFVGVNSAGEMQITLWGPARTKKNSTTLGIKQSAAYSKWCADVCAQLYPGIALPDADYNLAARFYVDRYGEKADLIGLLQGLADALEKAGIVSDDKYFRGLDGSRMYPTPADEPFRVELTISPLNTGAILAEGA